MDTLQDLQSAYADMFLHRQAIEPTTPAGRDFFHVLGAFSEFERDMIRSRVNAGLDRARAKGVRPGRPKVSKKVEGTIHKRLAAGEGRRIAVPQGRTGFDGVGAPGHNATQIATWNGRKPCSV
jgi:DNA invertase Pin-like site-specific DNA recombinase